MAGGRGKVLLHHSHSSLVDKGAWRVLKRKHLQAPPPVTLPLLQSAGSVARANCEGKLNIAGVCAFYLLKFIYLFSLVC